MPPWRFRDGIERSEADGRKSFMTSPPRRQKPLLSIVCWPYIAHAHDAPFAEPDHDKSRRVACDDNTLPEAGLAPRAVPVDQHRPALPCRDGGDDGGFGSRDPAGGAAVPAGRRSARAAVHLSARLR